MTDKIEVPSDEELAEFAAEEQFLLFCDEDEFVQIARAVLQRFGAAALLREAAQPARVSFGIDMPLVDVSSPADEELRMDASRWREFASIQSGDVMSLVRGAERYRWLRDRSRIFASDPKMNGNHWVIRATQHLRGDTLDDAIDAAIAAEKREG